MSTLSVKFLFGQFDFAALGAINLGFLVLLALQPLMWWPCHGVVVSVFQIWDVKR